MFLFYTSREVNVNFIQLSVMVLFTSIIIGISNIIKFLEFNACRNGWYWNGPDFAP